MGFRNRSADRKTEAQSLRLRGKERLEQLIRVDKERPGPLSITLISTISPIRVPRIVMCFGAVLTGSNASIAFRSRLTKTCWICTGSTCMTNSSAGNSLRSLNPARFQFKADHHIGVVHQLPQRYGRAVGPGLAGKSA